MEICTWPNPKTNFVVSIRTRSEEHTSELQSQSNLVCRLLLEKKKIDAHLGEERVREAVADRQRAAGGVADIGLLRLAARGYVGDENLGGAPRRRLHRGPPESS